MKLAVVTGHSSGLGEQIARLLLEAQWSVVGVSRRQESTLPREYPGRVAVVHANVADPDAVEAADRAASVPPSLIVNCAGAGVFREPGSYQRHDIDHVMEGNLTGLILFSEWAFRLARAGSSITLVNILSTAAKAYRPGETVYAAAKWGAKGYTRALRTAARQEHLPLRVVEVYPCGMKTAFWSSDTRDLSNYPTPGEVATRVVAAVSDPSLPYVRELTFEREAT